MSPPKGIEGKHYVEGTTDQQKEPGPEPSFNLVWSVIGIQEWFDPHHQPMVAPSVGQPIEEMAKQEEGCVGEEEEDQHKEDEDGQKEMFRTQVK